MKQRQPTSEQDVAQDKEQEQESEQSASSDSGEQQEAGNSAAASQAGPAGMESEGSGGTPALDGEDPSSSCRRAGTAPPDPPHDLPSPGSRIRMY